MSMAKQIFYHNLKKGSNAEIEIFERIIMPYLSKAEVEMYEKGIKPHIKKGEYQNWNSHPQGSDKI